MQLEKTLSLEVEQNNHSHAYLFVGPDDGLIRSSVEFFVQSLGCERLDITEVSPLNETGKSGEIAVDQIRALLRDLSLSPFGKYRLGIIHRVEKLNNASANILLKTLEEPPKNVVIILTASSNNVLPTIRSRCRLIRINGESPSESITFSYPDLIGVPLFQSFRKIEEIIKANEVDKLLTDLVNQFEEKLITDKDQKSVVVLEQILSAKKKLLQNVNQRLVLENLVILIKRQYGK